MHSPICLAHGTGRLFPRPVVAMELVSIPATPVEFAAILTSLSIEMVLFFFIAIQSCMATR